MFQLRELALLLVAVSGSASAAIGPVAQLKIVNRKIAPDGFSRSATLAGGTFPGPIIRGTKGDSFSINVFDGLTDKDLDLGTSIHWHGIFQHNTNDVDGAAFVTQCPLRPQESFSYRFNAGDQAGTFWYHSHFKNQYCDGLRGPLIIYDPRDPHKALYDVDNENTVITLGDWYHSLSTHPEITHSFDSTLINGIGRYPGGPSVPFAIVNVIRNRRYRFRLVSISCGPSFHFSIDGHRMTVIEVDGTNVQPRLIDGVELFAGQRYSVVVNANQPVSNYWIRALPNPQSGRVNFDGYTNVAILRYLGAPLRYPSDPSKNVPATLIPLIETDLHPLVPTPVPGRPIPGGADININLEAVLNDARTAYLINGASFKPPTVPVLLQILNGTRNASDLLPAGSIIGLEANKSVELTIPGGAVGGPHPVHLHGQAFHVVRSAGNSTYNFDNPIVRDVVSIGGTGDEVTIRFFTDNPGPWIFHCHNDWHFSAGFAVVFAVDVPEVSSEVHPSSQWSQLCPAYNNFIGEDT